MNIVDIEFTAEEKYRFLDSTFILFLIHGKNKNDEHFYAYVGIKANELNNMIRLINRNGEIRPSNFGKVFLTGKGKKPSKEDMKYMEDHYFFNHDKINVGILN